MEPVEPVQIRDLRTFVQLDLLQVNAELIVFFLHNRVEKKHRCQKMFCVFVTWLYDVIGSNSKKKFFSEKVCNYTSWKRALKMP